MFRSDEFYSFPKMFNARYRIEADFSRSIIGDFFLAISSALLNHVPNLLSSLA